MPALGASLCALMESENWSELRSLSASPSPGVGDGH